MRVVSNDEYNVLFNKGGFNTATQTATQGLSPANSRASFNTAQNDLTKATSWLTPAQAQHYNEADFNKAKENNPLDYIGIGGVGALADLAQGKEIKKASEYEAMLSKAVKEDANQILNVLPLTSNEYTQRLLDADKAYKNYSFIAGLTPFISDEQKKQAQQKINADFANYAKSRGVEPLIDENGNFWVRDKEGNESEVSPNLLQEIFNSGGEFLGELAGLFAGGKASKGSKLARAVQTYGAGALGAGAGRAYDEAISRQNLGLEQSLNDTLQATANGAIDSVATSLIGDMVLRGGKYAYDSLKGAKNEALQNGGNIINKGIESLNKIPFSNFITGKLNGNALGARDFINRALKEQGKDEVLSEIRNKGLGSQVEAKNSGLDKLNEILEDTQGRGGLVGRASEVLKDKITQPLAKSLANPATARIDEEVLDSALSNKALAQNAAEAINDRGDLSDKAALFLESRGAKAMQGVEGLENSSQELLKVLENYEKRIKGEYANATAQLESLAGNATLKTDSKLYEDIIKELESSTDSAYRPLIRENLKKAELGEEIGIKEALSRFKELSRALKNKNLSYDRRIMLDSMRERLVRGLFDELGKGDEAMDILRKANSDYAQMAKQRESKLGHRLSGNIDPEASNAKSLTQKVLDFMSEIRRDGKDFQSVTKGMNETEKEAFETALMKGVVNDNRLSAELDNGTKLNNLYDFSKIDSVLEGINTSGAKSSAVKEELRARAKLNRYADILLESIANKTALKNSQGIGYKATERMKVATANYLKDYITAALPLMPGSKNASHRIAFRRGINNLINSSDNLNDLKEKVIKIAQKNSANTSGGKSAGLGSGEPLATRLEAHLFASNVSKEDAEHFAKKTEEFKSKLENVVQRVELKAQKNKALKELEDIKGASVPKELSVDEFLKSLDEVQNKENFIKHLQNKEDAQSRLAYLNLVEPTLKKPDFIVKKGDRKDFIKTFDDGKKFFSLLITQDEGKMLITYLPKARKEYIKSRFENADLIQTFTSRASKK